MSLYLDFVNVGLCVIPLKKGVPQVSWSEYFHAMPSTDIVEKWRGNEYALVCGKVSGVIALDIDSDELAERLYIFAGLTYTRKRGSKGFTAFYRYNGEKSQNWKDASGNVICEILSDKRLTTIPPSPHRTTGKPYVWMEGGFGLIESVGTLPVLKEDFIVIMDAKYPKPKRFTVDAPQAFSDHDDIKLYEAEKMLTFIDAGCARDEWIQIGMALRDEFGDAACHVWHNWSATSSKYKHNDAQSAWRSFSHEGVTIATLVYFAKRNGWLPDYVSVKPRSKAVTITNPLPPQITVGGLVGDIANWITSTAIRPQPQLSLAAALSFVAAMKGHRVQSSMREARTNLLVLSLSPTGGGKDHPQYAVQKLIKRCGLDKIIMGRPTSGTGLLTGIAKSGGVSWLKVDEFGRYLANASGKQAQSHQREIVDYMIELYSCGNRTFYGRQYANEKDNPQIILEQPHFVCLGSTVEEKMRDACKSGEVIDGFLNRWLVFNSKERPKKNLGVKNFEPPQALLDKISKWLTDFPLDSYGNVNPFVIEFTREAWNAFLVFEEMIEAKLDAVPYPLNELYARAGEHVVKVATTLADDKWVGTPELQWAIHIVEDSINQIVSFASGIADNQHEQNVISIINVIKRAGNEGISQNELTQRTRKLNNRDRVDILRQLIDSEEIYAEKIAKKTVFKIA